MSDEKRPYLLDPIGDNAVSDDYVVMIDDPDFLETKQTTVAGLNYIENARAEGVENAIIAGAGLETDGSYAAPNTTSFLTTQDFVDAGLAETHSNALILLDAAIKGVDDKTACFEKTFTAAEILTLDTVPVQFLPAPTPGYIYDLVHIYGWVTFNTTAYISVAHKPIVLRFNGTIIPLASMPEIFLESAGTAYFKGAVLNDVELVSSAIEIYCDGAITTGDSEIALVACYAMIPNTISPSTCEPTCVPEIAFGIDAGAVNVMTVTTAIPYAPAQGLEVVIEAANSITSSTPTAAINGTGAIGIVHNDETGTALKIGEIVKGGRYTLSYDSALAKYKLKNPTIAIQIPHAADSGAVNAIAATYVPNVAMFDGMRVTVDIANTVTSTNPTFNYNGTGAKTIVTPSGSVIRYGMMPAGSFLELQWDATANKWQLKTLVSNLWVKKYYTYADFTDASTSKYLTIETALPANVIPTQMFIHVGAYFTGGTISDCNVYLLSDALAMNGLKVFSTAALNRFTPINWFGAGMGIGLSSGTWDWKIRLLSAGGNLNALTAGNLTVCYKLEQLNY
jgi:hypothetical protein